MELQEKCGVFGIYSADSNDVARAVYYGLWTLQHRGQEHSGIACTNGKIINCHKGKGLVAHIYSEKDLAKLKGNIAIGHNRYATSGKDDVDHSQPVCAHHNIIALAHNGNLPTVKKLTSYLKKNGIAVTNLNDSEMMYKVLEQRVVKGESIADAIKNSYSLFTGAFSLLVMTKNELVAVRDSFGIRPLCIGKYNSSYVFSSETCALDSIGATYIRDVNPGEMVIINKGGLTSVQIEKGTNNLDVFEFIYFARPDSILMGKNVYEVRKSLGKQLAKEVKIDADIVIPVPDSSIPSAIGFAEETGIPFEQALVKNRYIHRTFISPSQKQRAIGVKMKLNAITGIIKDKRVILIDDSIVRGTTSKQLADIFKEAGAKEIHLLVTPPPVIYPDFYGINTPNQTDLIASTMSLKELKEYIGVTSINYLSYKGMLKAVGIPESSLCTSCFTGKYPIDIGANSKKIKYIK